MSEAEPKEANFEKGDRAAIVSGRKGIGVRGSVFWIGENKYGPGNRYGLRGDDGETYWIDETEIGREDDAPPAPEPSPTSGSEPEKSSGNTTQSFAMGDSVEIVKGQKGMGVQGAVFWVGENKYGPGMRFGVRGDDGETYWVDEYQIVKKDAPQGGAAADPEQRGDANEFEELGPAAGAGDNLHAEPKGGGSELPPEAFEGNNLPPEAYDDDIPF